MKPALTIDPPRRRVTLFEPFDVMLEVAIMEREIMETIRQRISREQCGEAFEGLDTV